MTPILRAVYDELVSRASRPPFDVRAAKLRGVFDGRCGHFDPDHPAAGQRDAAAWEDLLTRGRLAHDIGRELEDPAERALAGRLLRAQRGVFIMEKLASKLIANDLWAGGSFVILDQDDVGRELATVSGPNAPLCQARLVAESEGCAVLPGTVFHPADARVAIEETLRVARDRGMQEDDALDALLRMEHRWRTYARVKVELAYCPQALAR